VGRYSQVCASFSPVSVSLVSHSPFILHLNFSPFVFTKTPDIQCGPRSAKSPVCNAPYAPSLISASTIWVSTTRRLPRKLGSFPGFSQEDKTFSRHCDRGLVQNNSSGRQAHLINIPRPRGRPPVSRKCASLYPPLAQHRKFSGHRGAAPHALIWQFWASWTLAPLRRVRLIC
jgi:hypothetical protein